MAALDDELADNPRPSIDCEIGDFTDRSVVRFNAVAAYFPGVTLAPASLCRPAAAQAR